MSIASSNKLRIRGIIYLIPGIHLRQLQRILGTSFHTTRYHVAALSQSGEIIRRQEGRYARLYPAVTDESERALYSLIQLKTRRRILKALSKGTGLTNKQIVERTGISKSAVSENLQTLLTDRIVRITLSEHGRVVYELVEPEKVLNILVRAEHTVMSVAADRFVELWDF